MEEGLLAMALEIKQLQNDKLRFGLHGVKDDIVGSHPLESAQKSLYHVGECWIFICSYGRKTQEGMKSKCILNTYGSAFPVKMDLDRQTLSRSLGI